MQISAKSFKNRRRYNYLEDKEYIVSAPTDNIIKSTWTFFIISIILCIISMSGYIFLNIDNRKINSLKNEIAEYESEISLPRSNIYDSNNLQSYQELTSRIGIVKAETSVMIIKTSNIGMRE